MVIVLSRYICDIYICFLCKVRLIICGTFVYNTIVSFVNLNRLLVVHLNFVELNRFICDTCVFFSQLFFLDENSD
jgi:hypothetical protein